MATGHGARREKPRPDPSEVRLVPLSRSQIDGLGEMAAQLRLESRKIFADRLRAIIDAWDAESK